MEKSAFKLVGSPCGHHGQYTFYKALRIFEPHERIIAIGDFFFVKIWQDSELLCIGELQLLWTDRVSDQTLVSLRLYFLPENTPEGRNGHGEDEVLAISEKVVLKAVDLVSWVHDGGGWTVGLRALWHGVKDLPCAPLRCHRLDFSDVDKEKMALPPPPGQSVTVLSYPRYCRYRAAAARCGGSGGDDLLLALAGYIAVPPRTRILYCRDTFDYPELETLEPVCNHLSPRLAGRPRGRRRLRRSRSRDDCVETQFPSRPRNGKSSSESDSESRDRELDRRFLRDLRAFHASRSEGSGGLDQDKNVSLRTLFSCVWSLGGYSAVSRRRQWGTVHQKCGGGTRHESKTRYERFLLAYENHKRRLEKKSLENGKKQKASEKPIPTIELNDSPLRDTKPTPTPEKRLRTPSPKPENEEIIDKPASQLNQEFLDSLQEDKSKSVISVKPFEQLLDSKTISDLKNSDIIKKIAQDNSALIAELASKYDLNDSNKILQEIANKKGGDSMFLTDLAQKLKLAPPPINGREASEGGEVRVSARSSLRSVRVKPARESRAVVPPRTDSGSSSPPVSSSTANNFGIRYPPQLHNSQVSSTNNPDTHSDDEIVEVPYKPKTPEIIDLDEYPESPQTVKKKKLDILKERGLEVTAVPNTTWSPQPTIPNIVPNPILLNPAMQHQIMTQAQLFQMYNVVPNFPNGVQPPRVIQGKSIFGSSGPEKTVYGNPKDPFMPPPHILQGTPIKPARTIPIQPPGQDILDLTCKTESPQKLGVEIVKVPTISPKPNAPQNLSKNYTLVDGKAVVGSNLEITLVSPKSQTPLKNRAPQKRSSNGQFMSAKTPTPPKEYHKYPHTPQNPKERKPNLIIPNYQIRDDSPTGSSSSRDSQPSMQNNLLNAYKGQNLAQILEMQAKTQMPLSPFMDPVYMSALYSSLAGQVDQRQLAMYRDMMADQYRGYTGLLNMGVTTPTTKN